MEKELKDKFDSKLEGRGLDKAISNNVILTITDEGYHLDVKNYNLFANTNVPFVIDDIVDEIFEESQGRVHRSMMKEMGIDVTQNIPEEFKIQKLKLSWYIKLWKKIKLFAKRIVYLIKTKKWH